MTRWGFHVFKDSEIQIQIILYSFFSPQELIGFNEAAADVNKDGNVNITDAVGIDDIILNAKE